MGRRWYIQRWQAEWWRLKRWCNLFRSRIITIRINWLSELVAKLSYMIRIYYRLVFQRSWERNVSVWKIASFRVSFCHQTAAIASYAVASNLVTLYICLKRGKLVWGWSRLWGWRGVPARRRWLSSIHVADRYQLCHTHCLCKNDDCVWRSAGGKKAYRLSSE